jgi:hypothetical protein
LAVLATVGTVGVLFLGDAAGIKPVKIAIPAVQVVAVRHLTAVEDAAALAPVAHSAVDFLPAVVADETALGVLGLARKRWTDCPAAASDGGEERGQQEEFYTIMVQSVRRLPWAWYWLRPYHISQAEQQATADCAPGLGCASIGA